MSPAAVDALASVAGVALGGALALAVAAATVLDGTAATQAGGAALLLMGPGVVAAAVPIVECLPRDRELIEAVACAPAEWLALAAGGVGGLVIALAFVAALVVDGPARDVLVIADTALAVMAVIVAIVVGIERETLGERWDTD